MLAILLLVFMQMVQPDPPSGLTEDFPFNPVNPCTVLPGTCYDASAIAKLVPQNDADKAMIASLQFLWPSDIVYDQLNQWSPIVARPSPVSWLMSGYVNETYGTWLNVSGGTPPYKYAATGLPNGLAVDPDTGVVTGILKGPVGNTTQIVFSVTDSTGKTVSTKALNMQVCLSPKLNSSMFCDGFGNALTFTTVKLFTAYQNMPYDVLISLQGGTPPYTLSVITGSIPSGLNMTNLSPTFALDPVAEIKGTPITLGTTTFTVRATDSAGVTVDQQYDLIVTVPLAVTTTSLPDSVLTQAYNAQLTAAGGVAPYTWAITAGSLPAGLALDPATGIISGIPNGAAGTSSFTVTVSDNSYTSPLSAPQNLSVTVAALTMKKKK